MSTAKLHFDAQEFEIPVIIGSEGERGIDISELRSQSGSITIDPGYGNTGSCESAITFIDGEEGILRYRGYPIEQLAENATFLEVCYLLIYGKLPNQQELDGFHEISTYHSMIHEDMKKLFEAYPPTAHPMAILSSAVTSISTYYPEMDDGDEDKNIARLLAKSPTIAASLIRSRLVSRSSIPATNSLTVPTS